MPPPMSVFPKPERIPRSVLVISKKNYIIINMHSPMEKILAKIKTDKNLDFTEYRESTITRRINRRVLFSSVQTISEYLKLIKKDDQELDALVQDWL
ncbi:hypothetical protein HN511_05385 [bacterium]|nr:hypothetical protein [bacterium]